MWLDRDATMGQLVSKLKPQLPPQQRDVTYCAIVTSGTNPDIYPLRFPYTRIMRTKHSTDMIASGDPIRLQLVWNAALVDSLTPQIDRLRQRLAVLTL